MIVIGALAVAGTLPVARVAVGSLSVTVAICRGSSLVVAAPLFVLTAGLAVFLPPALRRIGLIRISQNEFLYKK